MSTPARSAHEILATTARRYRTLERVAQAGSRPEAARRELRRHRRQLLARLADETSQEIREAILISQLCGITEEDLSTIDIAQIRREVVPTSPLWGAATSLIHPTLILALAAGEHEADSEGLAYLEQVRTDHPDESLRAFLIETEFWDALDQRDTDRWKTLFDQLIEHHGSSEAVAGARSAAERIGELTVGSPAPPFDLIGLDCGENLTLDSFRGSFLLLEFWATWCEPCLDDMDLLHAAHRDFSPRGLEILTVSVDDSVEDVHALRADPSTPMPWHHAFIGVDSDGVDFTDSYAAFGIPRAILIGPDGTIAVEPPNRFRGEVLLATLNQAMSPSGER